MGVCGWWSLEDGQAITKQENQSGFFEPRSALLHPVAPSKTFVVGFIGKKVYDVYVPRCGRVRLARKNAGVKPRPYYFLRSISIECDKTRRPIGHWRVLECGVVWWAASYLSRAVFFFNYAGR
jgi:hypothetical protein